MHPAVPRGPAAARLLRARTAALLLAIAPTGACGDLAAGGDDAPLVIGLAAPLTDGTGAADVFGVNSRDGALLAVEQINADGGIDGRRLELVTADDQGEGKAAIAAAQSLVARPGMLAVVGHVYSGTTIEAAPVYAEAGIPAVATAATSPAVSRLGDHVFRVASSDSANALVLAREAAAMRLPTAVIYQNDDYGRGLTRPFVAALRAAGGRVVAEDPVLDDVDDVSAYLLRMRDRGVGLIFLAEDGGAAERIVVRARELGLAMQFLGGDGIEGLVTGGPAYEGVHLGVLFHPEQSEASRRFVADFRARYRRDPDSQAALAYDAVRLIAGALRAGHRSPAAVREWLAGVGRPGGAPAFEGVAGPVRFDENGDPVEKSFIVGTIQNGRILLRKGGQ